MFSNNQPPPLLHQTSINISHTIHTLTQVYTYDTIFPATSNTAEVYDSVLAKSIDKKLLKGYNLTVLAYGQTGSGKTYTMGTNWEDGEDGVIPSAVKDLFKHTDDKVSPPELLPLPPFSPH